jgi:CheY-like chemotaxis protein
MPSRNRTWNSENRSERPNFSFALVINETKGLRGSIIALLRERGWLAHGISLAEEALNILTDIPYDLIVLNSELPGLSEIDFVRTLQNSREWRTIRLVVITSSESTSFANQIARHGAFLARRSRWQDDLLEFLSAGGSSRIRNTYSQIERSE